MFKPRQQHTNSYPPNLWSFYTAESKDSVLAKNSAVSMNRVISISFLKVIGMLALLALLSLLAGYKCCVVKI